MSDDRLVLRECLAEVLDRHHHLVVAFGGDVFGHPELASARNAPPR